MKVFTLTQATKQHDTNRLHDAFVAAGLVPVNVDSLNGTSRFQFQDSVTDPSIQAVVDAYVYAAPTPPVNLKQLANNFRTAVTNATNVAQIKNALNQELMLLLREMAKSNVADL